MEKNPNYTQLNIETNNGPIFGGTSNFYGAASAPKNETKAEEVPFEEVKTKDMSDEQPVATTTDQQPRTLSYAEKTALLPTAIQKILPYITAEREWFAVCKGIMKLKLVGDGDFKNAMAMIEDALPIGQRPKIKYHDIQKLDVQSFAKGVDLWDKSDSPVGKMTSEYQTIYFKFMGHFE